MGAHERAHFAAARKELWGPAAPLVPYHLASSDFFARGCEDAYKARTPQRRAG
jgi:hypothetical protein